MPLLLEIPPQRIEQISRVIFTLLRQDVRYPRSRIALNLLHEKITPVLLILGHDSKHAFVS